MAVELPPAFDSDGNEIFYDYIDEIPGYKVSQSGHIKGPSGKILSCKPHPGGYVQIHMRRASLIKHIYLHVMIARTFIYNDNPAEKIEVNHLDFDRSNNNVSNLEWVTHSENMQHQTESGRAGISKPVVQLDSEGNILQKWFSMSQASRETKITFARIKHACYNKTLVDGIIIRFESEDMTESDYRYKSHRRHHMSTPVVQMDLKGIPLKIWPGVNQAAEGIGRSCGSHIGAHIAGKFHTAYGFTWRHATEEEIREHLFKVPLPSEIHGHWKQLTIHRTTILVSSMGYIVHGHGSITLGTPIACGYMTVGISGMHFAVHRLVMEAFNPILNPDDFYVGHIDSDKTNNKLENLRWVTPEENSAYAVGLAVWQFDVDKQPIKRFKSLSEAGRVFGTNGSVIGHAIRNQTFYAYGYYWQLENV